jgi:hypothetical protein
MLPMLIDSHLTKSAHLKTNCFLVKKLLPFLCLFAFPLFSVAQISYGGTPYSFGSDFRQSKSAEALLTTYQLPAVDMQKIEAEDRQADSGNRFAVAIPVALTLQNSGLRQNLPNGDRLWRLKIKSEGAWALRVLFEHFYLPESSTLFIYSEDQQRILGAFTHQNNPKSGRFGTDIIQSNTIIVEFYEPKAVRGKAVLDIFRVDHAYRHAAFFKPSNHKNGSSALGFEDSGSCNVNVNCDLGADWQDEKRGIVKIVLTSVNGSDWCSGSLIDNTAQDNTPYILSANHCEDDGGQNFIDTWVFIFNYEAVGCSNPVNEPSRSQSMAGADLVSKYADSDFLLLRLLEDVPLSYGAYFNGWDRSGTNHTSSVCIHHPRGDIKKISKDNDPATTSANNGATGSGTTHFRVIWNNNTTTEGGSSGSPLFEPSGKITGQLHGGDASCSNLNAPDWYGKLSVSWLGGGSLESRLADWLDPANLGVTTLAGRDNNLLTHDVTVDKIQPTVNQCEFSANTPISITVKNRGSVAQNNIQVNYELRKADNTLVLNGNQLIPNLTGNSSTDVVVNINLSESSTLFIFRATATAPTDQVPLNNTIQRDILTLAYNDIFPYIEGFENSAGNWYSTGTNNTWEWGTPAGTRINRASEGTKAWVTNLDGNYLNNETSYLYSPVFDLSRLSKPDIYADIFVNCEQDYDGVQLQYSMDCGVTWERLGDVGSGTNWYNNTNTDLLFADNIAWSTDTVKTWKSTKHSLEFLAGQPAVRFRFAFLSDFSDVREGFGVDRFQISDITVEANRADFITLYPNPATSSQNAVLAAEEGYCIGRKWELQVTDMTGRRVFESKYESEICLTEIPLPTTSWGRGMYIVQLKTEQYSLTKRMVLQ